MGAVLTLLVGERPGGAHWVPAIVELEEVVEEARADTGETYENIDDVEELDEDEYYDSADDYGED